MTEISAPSPETLARYENGPEILRRALVDIRRVALLPPPRLSLSLSEWADKYAVLSKETSASHGKFRAFAYQNGIMDTATDPTVETITVMKSARVDYTKILDHVAGFFIHQGPSPLLIVQPRVEDAEDYGDPKTTHYICEANGRVIEEHDKAWMVNHGEWIAEKPFNGHAGFYIWAGYSLFANAAWPKLVEEFLSVKGNPLELKTFVNLVLGEPWEERGEEIDLHTLQARAADEGWRSEARAGELLPQPAGVLVTTCGVDVQGDRREVTRVGWGHSDKRFFCVEGWQPCGFQRIYPHRHLALAEHRLKRKTPLGDCQCPHRAMS